MWKDVSIERITKPNMVKMYRRLAKEGPPGETETTEETIKEIGIVAPLVGIGARYLAKKAVEKQQGLLQKRLLVVLLVVLLMPPLSML